MRFWPVSALLSNTQSTNQATGFSMISVRPSTSRKGDAAWTVARFLGDHRKILRGRLAMLTNGDPSKGIDARYQEAIHLYAGVRTKAFVSLEAAVAWLGDDDEGAEGAIWP